MTVIPEFVCLPAAASSLQALTLNISSWPQPTSPYIMGEQGNEDGSCFIYLLSKHLFTQALHVRLLVANCADEREQTDRQKDRQTDRQIDRQRDIKTYGYTDRLTDRQYPFLSQNWSVPPLLGQSCCSWTNLVKNNFRLPLSFFSWRGPPILKK